MSKIPILFKIMEERGVAAKKLSEDTGISTGNIGDWKSGRSAPSSDKLIILSKYFNVSIDYLLGNTADPTIPEDDEVSEYIDVLHKRGEMRMLFSVARNATKEDIEKAVKIIEALRDNQ